FKGKMAINDGLNNGSGRVKWLGTKHSIEAQFKAPLGQGSWTINETAANATLISSVNGESMAETAQELISYELGWHFPWNKLQYWLRGHQSDQAIQKIVKPKQSFTDSQWRIEFTQWTQTSLGLLPKKIKAIKAPYSVKLVIYDWQFE
ncbi:MAG: lipoprotein insertase outer membrane protein LolB, partial [Marinicellaceae bacterium]